MINETFFHPEYATFRALTGGAYNMPNAYGSIEVGSAFPTSGTIPKAIPFPGSFKTTGKAVRGDDNARFTQLIVGDFLYDGTYLRQIESVISDSLMFLREAFPTDVAAWTVVKICNRQFYKKIRAKNTHASAAATLQEAPFKAGDEFENGGAPITYAAGSGEISFTVHQ